MVSEDDPVLGAINVRFDTPREFSELEKRLMTLLGERCSLAMVRAQRFAEERRRRMAAEEALTTSRALEINDDIVQLIAEAKLANELGLQEQATVALERALAASKRVVATMTNDAVTFRRDALELDGILRVSDNGASSSTPA
jgi:GAF domain-containing protein